MGAFYGSTHLRTSDREAVLAAAEKHSRRNKTRLLVGPAIGPWIAVYPENNGQDDRTARLLSKSLKCEAVHVLVHDDDFFCYSAFRDGKAIDQFNSSPDYFAEVTANERKKLAGKPEKVAPWLVDSARLDELKELLAPDAARGLVYSTPLLERFADLIGLANAVTAYEYLMDGETDGIEQWDAFMHFPDLGSELAEKLAAEAKLEAAYQQLQGDGALLVRETRPIPPKGACKRPHLVADRAGGFLVLWENVTARELSEVEWYSPPWKSPMPIGFGVQSTIYKSIAMSPSGRFMATAHAAGDWNARLWDLERKTLAKEVPHDRVVEWVGFTHDETQLVSLGENDGFRTSISEKKTLALPVRDARVGVIHPDGTLVVGDEAGCLHFIDLSDGTIRKSLTLGNRDAAERRKTEVLALMRRSIGLADGMDFEQHLQGQMKQAEANLERMFGASPVDPAMREEIKANMAQAMEQMKTRFEELRERMESGDMPIRSTEIIFTMQISRDGRWLCLGTSGGVRIHDWKDAIAAEGYLSNPTFRFDVAADTADPHYVYSLAICERENGVLFGGLSGRIEFLSLADGTHRTLVEPPGNPTIHSMAISSDESAITCVALPKRQARRTDTKPNELHIWDLNSLFRGGSM